MHLTYAFLLYTKPWVTHKILLLNILKLLWDLTHTYPLSLHPQIGKLTATGSAPL